MTDDPQRLKGQDGALSSLSMAINVLNHAKEVSNVIPAKAAFDSAGILLAVIRVGFLPVHVSRPSANVRRIQWPRKRTTSNWG